MSFRVQMQVREALGDLNRYFCSIVYETEINDPELLMRHFVRSGGAANFAKRFNEAMGAENRWYCCEYYGYNIQEDEILWNYYMNQLAAKSNRRGPQNDSREQSAELALT